MNIYFQVYIFCWIILTFVWMILLIKNRNNIIIFQKKYFVFLFKKWKIFLFLLAVGLFSYISSLWFDPTWDIPETIIMSLLTFYTSVFSVGTLYRFYRNIEKDYIKLYIAFIFIFFSSSWFYDAYAIIFLTWYSPLMWISNLFISPFLYMFWWLTWSLDYTKKTGVIFVFTQKEWIDFQWEKWNFWKILLWSLPMIITIACIFWYFIFLSI